ncbi:TetR/AcrR family transcriptional regulator [Pelagibacterium halotolerans]|uniref:TetR/AcrR family transcriptional regulator n=1 Tax=Pelagibacterium halotolerans TaxID=531813 RepID=UPI00384BAF75
MPPPPESNTRSRILHTAFGLFLAHGYDGTGMAQLLSACGVSKGAFYHHFASKEALYREVVADFFLKPFVEIAPDALVTGSVEDSQDALAALYAHLPEQVAEATGQDMARYFAFFFESLSRLPDVRTTIRARYDALITRLAETIRAERGIPAADAEQEARAIVARFEGELYLAAVFENKETS